MQNHHVLKRRVRAGPAGGNREPRQHMPEKRGVHQPRRASRSPAKTPASGAAEGQSWALSSQIEALCFEMMAGAGPVVGRYLGPGPSSQTRKEQREQGRGAEGGGEQLPNMGCWASATNPTREPGVDASPAWARGRPASGLAAAASGPGRAIWRSGPARRQPPGRGVGATATRNQTQPGPLEGPATAHPVTAGPRKSTCELRGLACWANAAWCRLAGPSLGFLGLGRGTQSPSRGQGTRLQGQSVGWSPVHTSTGRGRVKGTANCHHHGPTFARHQGLCLLPPRTSSSNPVRLGKRRHQQRHADNTVHGAGHWPRPCCPPGWGWVCG